MRKGTIHIGTSGWSYEGWIGPFYPEDIGRKDLLPWYSDQFDTTEVNTSFYHIPSEKAVRTWIENTPADFVFACKANRYITHMKKLKDPEKSLPKLLDFVQHFGRKLGPILFQLPPKWSFNKDRLTSFLEALPGDYRYTFEFRDQSWLCDETYELLEKHQCSLCFYDFKEFQSPEKPTADFIYIRLHGPRKEAYTGSYDDRTLSGYAEKIRRWAAEGRTVYCYFDNDQKSRAPFDAQSLIRHLR